MKCIRCGEDLGAADDRNADYVIADDFIVIEKRKNLYAVTKDATRIRVKTTEEIMAIADVKRLETTLDDEAIQKTGVVCRKCYRETDFVIWGVHKLHSKERKTLETSHA